jgi:hypothetical protein
MLAVEICLLKKVEKKEPETSSLKPLLTLESFNTHVPSARAINIIIVDLNNLILGLRPLL